MKRLVLQVVVATALVALLAACSTPEAGGMTVRLDPVGNLGYEVSSSGELTVTSKSFVFTTAPGEPAATITGVHAAYFSSNGLLQEQWIGDPNSLSIFVPAGFTCTEPDERLGCTVLSPGAVAGPGQPSDPAEGQVQLLPHDIALAHYESAFNDLGEVVIGNTSWWAEYTFYGRNAYGDFDFTRTFFITAPTE